MSSLSKQGTQCVSKKFVSEPPQGQSHAAGFTPRMASRPGTSLIMKGPTRDAGRSTLILKKNSRSQANHRPHGGPSSIRTMRDSRGSSVSGETARRQPSFMHAIFSHRMLTQAKAMMLLCLLGQARAATEEKATDQLIAGFRHTVNIPVGWKSITDKVFRDKNPQLQIYEQLQLERDLTHAVAFTGSLWYQLAGFRNNKCTDTFDIADFMPGVVPNGVSTEDPCVRPATITELTKAIKESKYFMKSQARKDVNLPKSEQSWLSASGQTTGEFKETQTKWCNFLENMANGSPDEIYVIVVREMRNRGETLKAVWACELAKQQRLQDLMIDWGTGKFTVLCTKTGAQVFSRKYKDVVLSNSYLANEDGILSKCDRANDESMNTIPDKKFWCQSEEVMTDFVNNAFKLQGSDKSKYKDYNIKVEKGSFQVQHVPSRSTGDSRIGNNFTKFNNVLRKAGWEDVEVVSIEKEGCYCAAKAREMTNDIFKTCAEQEGITFNTFTGIECGNGSCEGGQQPFEQQACGEQCDEDEVDEEHVGHRKAEGKQPGDALRNKSLLEKHRQGKTEGAARKRVKRRLQSTAFKTTFQKLIGNSKTTVAVMVPNEGNDNFQGTSLSSKHSRYYCLGKLNESTWKDPATHWIEFDIECGSYKSGELKKCFEGNKRLQIIKSVKTSKCNQVPYKFRSKLKFCYKTSLGYMLTHKNFDRYCQKVRSARKCPTYRSAFDAEGKPIFR